MIRSSIPVILLALTLGLISIGITMVYSSSANKAAVDRRTSLRRVDPEAYVNDFDFHDPRYLWRQASYAGMGLALLLVMSIVDHQRLKTLAPAILAVTIVLLCLVFLPSPIGVASHGSRRWVNLGVFTLQPSEVAKLAIIIFGSSLLVKRDRYLDSFWKGVVPPLAFAGVCAGLIYKEKDLGAAAVLGMVTLLLMFVAGVRLRHLAPLVLGAVALGVASICRNPYQWERIVKWVNFIIYGPRPGDQVSQSVIAAGVGGLWGSGIATSSQGSPLPEAHTDFIFAIVAEELGFVRCLIIICAFAALIGLGAYVAHHAADAFGGYLAAGITSLLALSVCLNLLVVLGWFPPKGLALPFISYGGTSLLVNCAAVGILINVAKYAAPEHPVPARAVRRIPR